MAQTIAIIGLGRVGLPLALAFTQAGFLVEGIDTSEELVAMLLKKQMPFMEEGTPALLEKSVGVTFFPSSDASRVQKCRATILTLGTPVDEHMNPVFSQIESAVTAIVPYLRAGHLIVLRSTVSPGTTEYLGRFLKRHTSFQIGTDLFLAFCPERIAQGQSLEEIPGIPQIVGGLDPESTRQACDLFGHVTRRILPTDARSAELAKLFCNMYRYIDFAIANEFMMIAHQYDRDIHEIVELVNRDYKRGGLKRPGLTAGPCLYKDGFFLVNITPFNELISSAWKIHEAVPAYLIEEIKQMKQLEGAKVAILGLAYKKNIDDPRNSLSFKAKKIFLAEGADVHLHDPFLPCEALEDVLAQADIVFLAVNHDSYRTLCPHMAALVKDDALICDIWNLFGTGKIIYSLADRRTERHEPECSNTRV